MKESVQSVHNINLKLVEFKSGGAKYVQINKLFRNNKYVQSDRNKFGSDSKRLS